MDFGGIALPGAAETPLGSSFVPGTRTDGDRINWTWHADDGEPHPGGPAVIFDIDGVLSDAAGRQHFLERGRRDWTAFFEACGDDPVIEEIARLLELLDPSLAVILLTGRPTASNPRRWPGCSVTGCAGTSWSCAPRGLRPGHRVQAVGGGDLRAYGFDLRLAFEDDPSNHAMYVAAGVPCVYIHSGYYE